MATTNSSCHLYGIIVYCISFACFIYHHRSFDWACLKISIIFCFLSENVFICLLIKVILKMSKYLLLNIVLITFVVYIRGESNFWLELGRCF